MGRKRDRDVDGEQQNERTIKELKAANRRLKSDNQRLKMELNTLNEAFKKTGSYLKNNTDNISVESIIEGIKKGSSLEEIKKSNKCEKCGEGPVKDFHVANVGRIILCTSCKTRKVIKGEEKER